MDIEEIRTRFSAAIAEIVDSCRITDEFVDKDRFRIYIATVWGNAVLAPERSGISEEDLTDLHDYLNEEILGVLGTEETVATCFEYLASKNGEDAMSRLQVTNDHREFIHYFARLIAGAVDGFSEPRPVDS